jgi:hypothetical protein
LNPRFTKVRYFRIVATTEPQCFEYVPTEPSLPSISRHQNRLLGDIAVSNQQELLALTTSIISKGSSSIHHHTYKSSWLNPAINAPTEKALPFSVSPADNNNVSRRLLYYWAPAFRVLLELRTAGFKQARWPATPPCRNLCFV